MNNEFKIIRKEGAKRRPLWLIYTLFNIYPSLYKASTYIEARSNLKRIIDLIKSSSFIEKKAHYCEDEDSFTLFNRNNKEVVSFIISSN